MLSNLLVYRLVLLNVLGAVLLAVAGWMGYVRLLVVGQQEIIVMVMAGFFLYGIISVFKRAGRVSSGMNQLKRGERVVVDPVKFEAKNQHVREVCVFLVTFSLLGNVIGFAIAVSGQHDLESARGLLQLAGQFMDGMRVAFFTTIVGVALALWLSFNELILRTATTCFLRDAAGS